MTENTITSPRPSLFARKGEAEPAPAVAYVSLRQMQGESDRRSDEPDRRATWGDGQSSGESPDSPVPHRRVSTPSASDHDGRRHFTPRSGLALGQRYVPWTAPEDQAEAPKQTAKARKASPSVSTLSSLIHRHRDGASQPASRALEPASVPPLAAATASPDLAPATPRQPAAPTAAGPTKIDMSYLSQSDSSGRRPASPKPQADPIDPQAPPATAPRKRKPIRRKVTIRLEAKQFNKIKSLSDKSGTSQQSVMAAAVADYLSKLV